MKGSKKSLTISLIGLFITIFLIPYAINIAYSSKAPIFFTVWTGSDLLIFYGAYLTFIGTTLLGVITVTLNKCANETNNKILELQLSSEMPLLNFVFLKKSIPQLCLFFEHPDDSNDDLNIHSIKLWLENPIDTIAYNIKINHLRLYCYNKAYTTIENTGYAPENRLCLKKQVIHFTQNLKLNNSDVNHEVFRKLIEECSSSFPIPELKQSNIQSPITYILTFELEISNKYKIKHAQEFQLYFTAKLISDESLYDLDYKLINYELSIPIRQVSKQ